VCVCVSVREKSIEWRERVRRERESKYFVCEREKKNVERERE
jgi:hypothetical protein